MFQVVAVAVAVVELSVQMEADTVHSSPNNVQT